MTARSEFFRANVGAVIVDDKGNVLAFQRARTVEHAWQLPQGGLEVGELPRLQSSAKFAKRLA